MRLFPKNTSPIKMTNTELKIYFLPLKIKAHVPIVTWKKEMIDAYMRWKDGAPPVLSVLVAPVEGGRRGMGDDDESNEDGANLGFAVVEV